MALSLGRITGTLDLEDKFTPALEGTIKSTLGSMGALGSAITGVAAGFVIAEKVVGAFVSAVSGAVSEMTQLAAKAEQLQNKALTTGLTTGAIQSLQRLSENSGLSADALTFAVSRMQRALTSGGDSFRKIGLDATELTKLGTSDQLKMVADRIMSLATPAERASAAMQVFGRSGAQLLPVLKSLAEGNEALKISMSDAQIADLAELDDAIDDVQGAWSDLKEQFFATLAASPAFVGFLREATELIIAMVEPVGILASGLGMVATKLYDIAHSPLDVAEIAGLAELELPDVAKRARTDTRTADIFAGPAQINFADPLAELKKVEIQQEAITKKLKEQEQAQQEALRAAVEYTKAVEDIAKATDDAFNTASIETYNKVLKDAVKAGEDLAEFLAKNEAAGVSLLGDQERIDDFFNNVDVIGPLVANAKAAMPKAVPALALDFQKSFKESIKGLPDVILGAIQGGGDVFKAVGAKIGGDIMGNLFKEGGAPMKFLTDKLGKTIGSALGSLAGPLGSIAGSLLGKGLDKLTGALGIGGNKVIMQVNDMRDSFFEAQGGFVELQKKLVGLTDQDLVKKIFDAKTVEQFNAAVGEVNALLGNQEMAQENLNAAIERYGFTLEELPMKMRQDEINAGFAQILQDFELLKAAGFDTNLVLEKMGPNVSDFVNKAIEAGATIPEALRPILEQAAQAGELIHADGSAFTEAEVAGLNFGQTMDEKFTTLIDKITQMVNALLGIPTDVSTNINVNTNYTSSGRPGSNEVSPPWDAEFQHGGIVRSPTVGLVGESGPEAIVPLSQLGQVAGPTTAELSPTAVRSITRAVRDAMLQAG